MTMYMKKIKKKTMKEVGLLCKVQPILPQTFLLIIYTLFIRPHLDYCNVIYDQPTNESFLSNIEIAQYNKASAITGAIKGTPQEKLYEELGLEYSTKYFQLRYHHILMILFLQ